MNDSQSDSQVSQSSQSPDQDGAVHLKPFRWMDDVRQAMSIGMSSGTVVVGISSSYSCNKTFPGPLEQVRLEKLFSRRHAIS